MKIKDIIGNENFCPAPWIHAVVTPRGSVRPCNDFSMYVDRITSTQNFHDTYNSSVIKDVRTSIINDKVHPGCASCREKEKRVGYCKRNSLLNGIKYWGIEETELDIESPTKNVIWLDIRLSNACNLKCRHCYPVLSSAWKGDAGKLREMEIGEYIKDVVEYKLNEKYELSRDIVVDVSKGVGQLRRLEFKGGEPLIRQDLIEDFIRNMNYDLKEIQIDIISNGTVKMKDSLMELLNECKLLKMDFSVEAGEKMFNYIRGISLEDLKETIFGISRNVAPSRIGFRITQMVYNIFEYPNAHRWIKGLNLKEQLSGIFIHNYVVHPKFLNVLNLPLDIRLEAQQVLSDFIVDNECDETVYKLKNTLGKPQIKENVDLLKSYTKNLDEVRGVSLLDVEPRIGRYIYDQ